VRVKEDEVYISSQPASKTSLLNLVIENIGILVYALNTLKHATNFSIHGQALAVIIIEQRNQCFFLLMTLTILLNDSYKNKLMESRRRR